MNEGQTFSVSLFYKSFIDPIELTVFNEENPDTFQPRNLGDSRLYGIELEMRKNMAFIAEKFKNIFINSNVSFIDSELKMGPAELESRLTSARTGEKVEETREMQGQSPYLINVGLSYVSENSDLDIGFYYNVQGSRLAVIGLGRYADVYDDPFNSLNFKLIKSFGEKKRSQLSFSINNILNDKLDQSYKSFESDNFLFSRRNPGVTFGLGFNYNF